MVRAGHLDAGETFIPKLDPTNGGSAELALGKEIVVHKHPNADEILSLQTGTARVHLGDSVREVHAGTTVFILMRDGFVREGENPAIESRR